MKCPPKKSHTYTRCIWTNQTRTNSVSNGFWLKYEDAIAIDHNTK